VTRCTNGATKLQRQCNQHFKTAVPSLYAFSNSFLYASGVTSPTILDGVLAIFFHYRVYDDCVCISVTRAEVSEKEAGADSTDCHGDSRQ
jgi:hypothetical protein